MPYQRSSTPRDYEQPFNWWGYRPTPQRPLSIVELIHHQTLDEQVAAFLWIAMERHASIIVAATPHEAGKTTMLTALLDFLPSETERIYLRGWYERFEFLAEERDPATTYLLSNEISSHLPIYMWGRGVRKLFEAAGQGYGFGATVHANGAEEVLSMLGNYPLEVPDSLRAKIDIVITKSFRPGTRDPQRRVMNLQVIDDVNGVPLPRTIASREVIGTELRTSPGTLIDALVRTFGVEYRTASNELAQRVSFLRRLVRSQTFTQQDVRKAIKRYRERSATSRTDSTEGRTGR
jgi:hypothetical protein